MKSILFNHIHLHTFWLPASALKALGAAVHIYILLYRHYYVYCSANRHWLLFVFSLWERVWVRVGEQGIIHLELQACHWLDRVAWCAVTAPIRLMAGVKCQLDTFVWPSLRKYECWVVQLWEVENALSFHTTPKSLFNSQYVWHAFLLLRMPVACQWFLELLVSACSLVLCL